MMRVEGKRKRMNLECEVNERMNTRCRRTERSTSEADRAVKRFWDCHRLELGYERRHKVQLAGDGSELAKRKPVPCRRPPLPNRAEESVGSPAC